MAQLTMGRMRVGAWLLVAGLAAAMGAGPAAAQSAEAPATPAPVTPAPAVPAPVTPTPPAPATPAPSATVPAPPAGAVPAPAPDVAAPPKQPPDTSISQTLDVPARPALTLSGKSTWDEGFKTITADFARLNEALAKAKITATAHPLAVFTETDDNGFSFSAEIPLDAAPPAGLELPADVKIGETPSGKAMRFQHRGSYEEIDSTYEAITAYLDEKGLEARNLFAEDYLNQVKTSDDSALEIDIYVFLK